MKFLFWKLRIAILLLSFPVFSQSTTENYVLSRTYRMRGGEVTSGTKYWGNPDQVQTSLNYLDGLGKPKQNVVVAGTPKKRDIASISLYNSMHELEKEYLPVAMPDGKGDFKSANNINTAAAAYYNDNNTANPKIGDPTAAFWTETVSDNSPLNRVKNQKAPGVTTGVRKNYRTNQSLVHGFIKLYKVVGSGALDGTVANYGEGTLNVVSSEDENDKKVEEFTDHNGRVILKRVAGQEDTYYVFNEKGQLRYVLQPQYQETSDLSKYAFQYTYDLRGRVATKRIPGQGVSTMTYDDNTDLLQTLVDGAGRQYYYKYDNLNRQTEMGIILKSKEEGLVKTKYDNYSGVANTFDAEMGLTDTEDFVGLPKGDSKKGLTTMVSTRVLDGSEALGEWLNKVFFYDKKGRLVQTQRQLYNLDGESGASSEQVSYQLDFAGNIIREFTKQMTGDGIYRLEKIFKYDHQNRLLSVGHTFFKDGVQKLSYTHVVNTYNEIGSLLTKSLHNGKQELSYLYTPRGWVYTMKNGAGKTYKVDLRYNANGNINKLIWQTQGFGGEFSTMAYDGSNRLTAAEGAPYSEFGITYDKNGNIITLKRNKDGVPIDDLVYHDSSPGANAATNYNGNQLTRVVDNSNSTEGFNNGSSGAEADYAYDQNGNLTSDKNKGITAIAYNALNLPQTVTMDGPSRTLQYIYDGAGNKLKSVFPSTSTHYAGAFEYDGDGDLVRVALEEGQLVPVGDGDFEAQYYLRDHLDNVRMVINQEGNVVQETQYYAFGLPMTMNGTDAENKYQFLGKESQKETRWIDLQARFYDPTTGRFMSVDPVTDGQEAYSPYHYSFDNPMRFSDPDGKWPGEGWWKKVKNYWNSPLTKEERATSRAYNLAFTGADYESNTKGELTLRAIGLGLMYYGGHGYKPGATWNRSLPRKVMQRNAPAKSPAAKSSAPTTTPTAAVTAGKQNVVEASPVTPLLEFSGTEKAWGRGATPNSKYTYLSGDGTKAVSNYIYDWNGEVTFQVDFSAHGGGKYPSGHGHEMATPGDLGSGHKGHIPPGQVNPDYKKIPEGIKYSTPPAE